MGAVFFALAAGSLWGLARRRSWGFGAFWFFVALAPMSNVVPFTALAADRFLYLSMAGAALALANGSGVNSAGAAAYPPVAFWPNRVPWGPFSTSTRCRSRVAPLVSTENGRGASST